MDKVNLNLYNNDWYKPGKKITIVIWQLVNRIFISSYLPFPSFFKSILLRLFGAKIGKGVVLKQRINIKYPWFLSIGNYTWIGEDVWIDNLAQVNIGDNACLSQGAYLLTGNHNYKKVTFDLFVNEISIESGVWIGAKAIVCPGVTCKTHSILTVGSVATSNLEAYSIYQGVPAEFVKKREVC